MPKRPHVPSDPREEIPLSQFVPPSIGNDAETNSQPQAAPTFVIPVPPPMPKSMRPLRPKQRILRSPTPFSDVAFSTRHAQPAAITTQNLPIHQQQPLIPQGQPQAIPSTSNQDAPSQETVAAARGTTPEMIFNFMPTLTSLQLRNDKTMGL
ncbi:hypothetical protein PIB30_098268 [Stylosanthes scabra]|uniref:Uncharacterized protein n=1 Tax=Stylosanthes scabra TaxID=79078 RepID=A0ABU6RWX5_9FABA|nr:hypothetical protein [Stylosanthes scabra]